MSTTAKTAASSTSTSVAIGINAEGASKILTAIENYKKVIKSKIDSFGVTAATVQKGIQGEGSQKDLQVMINAIKQKQLEYLNYLDQYTKLLQDVITTYKSNDSSHDYFTTTSKSFK